MGQLRSTAARKANHAGAVEIGGAIDLVRQDGLACKASEGDALAWTRARGPCSVGKREKQSDAQGCGPRVTVRNPCLIPAVAPLKRVHASDRQLSPDFVEMRPNSPQRCGIARRSCQRLARKAPERGIVKTGRNALEPHRRHSPVSIAARAAQQIELT